MKIKASRCIYFHLSFEEPVVDSMKDWERDSNLQQCHEHPSWVPGQLGTFFLQLKDNGAYRHNTKVLDADEAPVFNPLGPKSDQYQFSPNDIVRSSRVKVMRITKLIINGKMFDIKPNSLNCS